MRYVRGEQLAQVDNADPFASPVWRSPVYRTPEPVIWLVQFLRSVRRLVWFLVRHPLLELSAAFVFWAWRAAGWPGITGLAITVSGALVVLRLRWPGLLGPGPGDARRDHGRCGPGVGV